jgi:hypothetical protein
VGRRPARHDRPRDGARRRRADDGRARPADWRQVADALVERAGAHRPARGPRRRAGHSPWASRPTSCLVDPSLPGPSTRARPPAAAATPLRRARAAARVVATFLRGRPTVSDGRPAPTPAGSR